MGLRLGLYAQRLLLSGTALRHKLGLRSAAGRDAAGAQRHSAGAAGLRDGVGEGTWLSAKRPGEWKGLMLRLVTDQRLGKQESGLSRACPAAHTHSPRPPPSHSLAAVSPSHQPSLTLKLKPVVHRICLPHSRWADTAHHGSRPGTQLRQYQRHRA